MSSEKKEVMGKIADINISYFAGLFDGEGWVTIGFSQGMRKSGKVWKHWFCKIGIKMTNYEVLKWIQDNFGGRLYVRNPEKSGFGGKKILYVWIETKKENIQKLCHYLLPFVKIKKEQLKIILKYFNDFINISRNRKDNDPIRKDEWQRRVKLNLKLIKLNGNNQWKNRAKRKLEQIA